MSNLTPTDADRRFMDEMASLMAPWGWSRPVARMFAYLLIREEPVTLDRLSEDLAISKSLASVTARELEQYGNARRHSQPGTKQILYSAPDLHAGPFTDQAAMMGVMASLLDRQRERHDGEKVSARLTGVASFLRAMQDAIEGVMARREFRD